MALYKIFSFRFLVCLNTWANLLFQTAQELPAGQTSILICIPHRHRCHETEPKPLDHASLAYTSFSNLTKTPHKATDHHFASCSLVSSLSANRVLKWKPAESLKPIITHVFQIHKLQYARLAATHSALLDELFLLFLCFLFSDEPRRICFMLIRSKIIQMIQRTVYKAIQLTMENKNIMMGVFTKNVFLVQRNNERKRKCHLLWTSAKQTGWILVYKSERAK